MSLRKQRQIKARRAPRTRQLLHHSPCHLAQLCLQDILPNRKRTMICRHTPTCWETHLLRLHHSIFLLRHHPDCICIDCVTATHHPQPVAMSQFPVESTFMGQAACGVLPFSSVPSIHLTPAGTVTLGSIALMIPGMHPSHQTAVVGRNCANKNGLESMATDRSRLQNRNLVTYRSDSNTIATHQGSNKQCGRGSPSRGRRGHSPGSRGPAPKTQGGAVFGEIVTRSRRGVAERAWLDRASYTQSKLRQL